MIAEIKARVFVAPIASMASNPPISTVFYFFIEDFFLCKQK